MALAQLMNEEGPPKHGDPLCGHGAAAWSASFDPPRRATLTKAVQVSSFSRSMKIGGHPPQPACRPEKSCPTARRQAEAILQESFGPIVVVGTGGYASYPMIKYAAKAGIPTAVHESNMVPGLTTKMLEGFCRPHHGGL
jgi:UDP-N-acetylglucosamine--N-acetylmuramyl-(pentapeptide) pyrophosphoryl-undecaprenol N-acetylglucosamine transferase